MNSLDWLALGEGAGEECGCPVHWRVFSSFRGPCPLDPKRNSPSGDDQKCPEMDKMSLVDKIALWRPSAQMCIELTLHICVETPQDSVTWAAILHEALLGTRSCRMRLHIRFNLSVLPIQ